MKTRARTGLRYGIGTLVFSASLFPPCFTLPMKFLEGQFWIYGTSSKWSLSVPFCPLCEAEAFESFCRSQIIH
jgi:hypothetical protein